MVYVDRLACWAAASLFNAAGFLAALSVWDVVFSPKHRRDYRRLLWLLPAILVSAWLESALHSGVANRVAAEDARLSALYRQMGIDVVMYAVLSLAIVGIRRAVPLGRPKSAPFRGTIDATTEGSVDTELRHAVERFLASVDSADVAAIDAAYAPEFTCVRLADEGGFARLTREQMLSFLNRAGGHAAPAQKAATHPAAPTRETAVHHAEIVDDIGLVLLTRVKDLGSGWEPLFYSLVWKRQDGEWRLLREFVHQRTVPRWR